MSDEQIRLRIRASGRPMSHCGALNRSFARSIAHFCLHWTQLPCCRLQSTHTKQVIGGGNDVGVNANGLHAARHGAAQPAIGFHPAEDLLDALSLLLADRVAGMTSRAHIEPWGVA